MEKSGLEANAFLGLIKFFRNEEYLDKLIGGMMHCQTPESFRLSNLEGVSDPAESCLFSWRPARGDTATEFDFNGKKLNPDEVLRLTIHNGKPMESWLHCWFCLRVPEDTEALEGLKRDLRLMKEQFGRHYAFLANTDVRPFIAMLQDAAGKKVWAQEVEYTEDVTRWDLSCKSATYAYQREYRFGFGKCELGETEPYVFTHPDGFAALIRKSPEVTLRHQADDTVLLDLKAL